MIFKSLELKRLNENGFNKNGLNVKNTVFPKFFWFFSLHRKKTNKS